MANISNTSIVQLLYLGYYGRVGEPEGIKFWEGQLDKNVPIATIAAQFGGAKETSDVYTDLADGKIDNPNDFVNQIYQNLFGRDADANGLKFWSDQLHSGADLGKFILSVINGAQGSDVDVLLNKAEVADEYQHSLTIYGKAYNNEFAHNVTDTVTADHSTVTTAVGAIKTESAPTTGGGGNPGGGGNTDPVEPTHVVTENHDATIHVSGTKNYDGLQYNFGNGNYATHQNVVIDHTAAFELDLGGNYRTGNQIIPTVDENGVAHIQGNAGHQIGGVENTQSDNLNRGAISISYGANSGVTPLDQLDNKTLLLKLDTDPGVGTNFINIELRTVAPGVTIGFLEGTDTAVIGDDDGNGLYIAQNSINPAFEFWGSHIEGRGPNAGDIPVSQLDIHLQLVKADDHSYVYADNHVILDLVAPVQPEVQAV